MARAAAREVSVDFSRVRVAPMMDWTDRHCRYFLRQVNPRLRLYTEMVTTGALIHGDVERHLGFSHEEHPLALQLGGSEPEALAFCATLGERYGYDEINLNIGCPSERVQKGAFGACLMAEPRLVAECVAAIRETVKIPVTVKHRIGLDREESYSFVHDFVATVAQAGCRTFIVHARNAVLKGLSPKENREIPPLNYAVVYRLKQDFSGLEIVINGGIVAKAQIEDQLQRVDGVMVGRAAYHDPWILAEEGRSRAGVVHAMKRYCEAHPRVALRSVARHMLGLYHGTRRARLWRRLLSDSASLAKNDPVLLLRAHEAAEADYARAA